MAPLQATQGRAQTLGSDVEENRLTGIEPIAWLRTVATGIREATKKQPWLLAT